MTTAMTPWTRWLPWALALMGGVLWGLQFGETGWVAAPWIALVPLVLLIDSGSRRRAALFGWLHGFAFWLTSIYWIAPTLTTFGGLPTALSAALTVGLAMALGLYHLVFSLLGWSLIRPLRRSLVPADTERGGGWWVPVRALVGLPALWVALEWLRGTYLPAFPWNLAAYSWIEVPGALPLSAWGGSWGLSFVVLFANVGIAIGILQRRRGDSAAWPAWSTWPAWVAVLVPLCLLPIAGRNATEAMVASGEQASAEVRRAGSTAGRSVRVVQPNIPNQSVETPFDPQAYLDGFRRLIDLSNQACDRPGALIIWPESALWPYDYEREPRIQAAVSALGERGCSVLLNSTHKVSENRYFNSAFLIEADGTMQRYDKRHLVPFGEYVPFTGVFGFIDQLARNAGSYSAAEQVTLLNLGGDPGSELGATALGPAICFEVTFPSEVADLVRAGSTALVTITNDAWYGDTSAPWQHLRAARFRAAESRRPLLRAAITGVSAVIGSDGSMYRSLGVGEVGVLRARLPNRSLVRSADRAPEPTAGSEALTPFSRRPWVVPVVCWLLAAFAIVSAARSPRSDDLGGAHQR